MDATAATGVGVLAGVLLDMGAFDADASSIRQIEPTVDIDRTVELTDLIVLGHIGVEVVLAGEHRRFDTAMQGPTQAHGQLNDLIIEDWQ